MRSRLDSPTLAQIWYVVKSAGLLFNCIRALSALSIFHCPDSYASSHHVHRDLVDIDNAGRLNKAQFCMGLYLIDERLGTGLIPLEVSDELWVSIMQ